jgi:hypothetical protein
MVCPVSCVCVVSCRALTEIPVIYFKKDVLLNVFVERKILDPLCVDLFFDEMAYNVLQSLYPCDVETAVYLASLSLQLGGGSSADDVE